MTIPVSVVIAARNEEANIRKCMESLSLADEVVLADSDSTDDTTKIAREFECEVIQFRYTGGYPKKRQWVIDNYPFRNTWILLIDADEVVTANLWEAIKHAIDSDDKDAYLIQKQFHFLGKEMRFGGFSHQAVLLFRRGCASFEETMAESSSGLDMEIHERLIVKGKIGTLRPSLKHEDFKGLRAYIDRHNAYSTWEAQLRFEYLENGRYKGASIKPELFGNSQARRRFLKHLIIRLPFESALWFLYHYIVRGGFLEGKPGYIAARMRANYIQDVRDKVYEAHRGLK